MPSPTKERNQRCNRCKAPPMRQATFSDNTNQPHSRYFHSRLSNTQLTTLFISFARRNNWAHSVFTFNNAGLLFAQRGNDSGRYSGGLECWPCRCSAVASGNTNLPAVLEHPLSSESVADCKYSAHIHTSHLVTCDGLSRATASDKKNYHAGPKDGLFIEHHAGQAA